MHIISKKRRNAHIIYCTWCADVRKRGQTIAMPNLDDCLNRSGGHCTLWFSFELTGRALILYPLKREAYKKIIFFIYLNSYSAAVCLYIDILWNCYDNIYLLQSDVYILNWKFFSGIYFITIGVRVIICVLILYEKIMLVVFYIIRHKTVPFSWYFLYVLLVSLLRFFSMMLHLISNSTLMIR